MHSSGATADVRRTFSVARRVGAEQALPILFKPTRVEWELLGE